ncbi:MAG: acyltransferase [Kytococcus sp.]|nr:acyltransferase [Kytococcus sp.]
MTAGPGDTTLTADAKESAAEAHHGAKGKKNLRGDIEGLRAVAVGTVLLYHVGIPFIPGGFVGVDIFFVISGFLITSLLLREAVRTGGISIGDFYARRARRLLPAASVVLLFTAVAGWLVLPGPDRLNLGTDVIAATFYVINWALALRSVDYLAEDAAPSALQHYWSLSVEEQFYVVWPLIIIAGLFLARRTRMRPKPLLFGILGIIAAASLVYSVLHTRSDPATAYFYTTTRVWELAIGALLAFLVLRLTALPRLAAELLGGVGLLMILWSAFFLTSKTPWPGSWALVPTLGAACIIAAGCSTQATATARLLSLKPMVWIGGLSYAIYLWHWPLITLAQSAYPEVRIRHLVVLGIVSIVLAWLTKHLVEDPIRFHPGLSAKASRGLLFGLASMIVTALVGTAVWATVPKLDENAKVTGATSLVANPESDDWTIREDLDQVVTNSGAVTPDPAVAPEDVPSYYDDDCQVQPGDSAVDTSCVYGAEDGDKTIAMLGDSKMGQWFPAVESIAGSELAPGALPQVGLRLHLRRRQVRLRGVLQERQQALRRGGGARHRARLPGCAQLQGPARRDRRGGQGAAGQGHRGRHRLRLPAPRPGRRLHLRGGAPGRLLGVQLPRRGQGPQGHRYQGPQGRRRRDHGALRRSQRVDLPAR